jgi:hypothetical protein
MKTRFSPTVRSFLRKISLNGIFNELGGETGDPRHPAVQWQILVLGERGIPKPICRSRGTEQGRLHWRES